MIEPVVVLDSGVIDQVVTNREFRAVLEELLRAGCAVTAAEARANRTDRRRCRWFWFLNFGRTAHPWVACASTPSRTFPASLFFLLTRRYRLFRL